MEKKYHNSIKIHASELLWSMSLVPKEDQYWVKLLKYLYWYSLASERGNRQY